MIRKGLPEASSEHRPKGVTREYRRESSPRQRNRQMHGPGVDTDVRLGLYHLSASLTSDVNYQHPHLFCQRVFSGH